MSRSRYTSQIHSVERRQATVLAEDLSRLAGSLHGHGAVPVAAAPVEAARERRRVRRECNQRHKPARAVGSE